MPKIEVQISHRLNGHNLILTIESDESTDIKDFIGRIQGGYRIKGAYDLPED